jgi:hypothetical protein
MAATLPHTAVCTILRDEDRTAAFAAIAHFDAAVSVSDEGDHIVVECESQRGPRGAYTFHSIACAHRALVHITF